MKESRGRGGFGWQALGGLLWAAAVAWPTIGAPGSDRSADAERAELRRSMLGTIPPTREGAYEAQPNAEGAYIYEATSARPVVEGGLCDIEADQVVEGLTLVRGRGTGSSRIPDAVTHPGVYWRLGEIAPGRYWIGVVFESQRGGIEAAEGHQSGVTIYLNGRIVQSAGHSDPVQVAPGIWFIESHAQSAVDLKPGDEISAATARGARMARLVLRTRAPQRGPHRMATNFGGHQSMPYTAQGVTVDAYFVDRTGARPPPTDDHRLGAIEQRADHLAAMVDDDGRTRVVFELANPLPISVTVALEATVTSYFRETLAQLDEPVTLAPHATAQREASFVWREDEPAQTVDAVVRAVDAPAVTTPREAGGLGWPALETYAYFPGHRHLVAWPDPYTYRVVRRITLQHAADAFRDRMVLNARAHEGVWERAVTPLLNPPMPPPDDLDFEPTHVPQHYGWTGTGAMRPQPHAVYNRRRFEMPADLSGRSYRLVIDDVRDEGTAYVNGVRVGQMRGQATPLIGDITHAVRPGTNELTVVVRDLLAIMNPDYVDPDHPEMNRDYLDAPGLMSERGMAMGGAAIEMAPDVSAEDVLVLPSVRQQTLGARIAAANRRREPVRLQLRAVVLDAGEPVLTVGERELTLAPDTVETVTLEQPWPEARLWGPTDPHLYVLAVELVESETGRVLDRRRERFGFRESWIEGPHVMFNGRPMRPVGHQPTTRLKVGGNQLIARLAGGRGDYFDEIGQLSGQGITGLQNQPSQHNVERDAFWDAVESNALIKLRQFQNHPSIITWELSNEWLWYLQYSVNDIMTGARRFEHLSDTVRAYDPSRWTRASAEGDAFGLLDNMDFHYMSPYFHSTGYGMRETFAYFPDGQFWRPLDRHLAVGEEIPLSPFHQHIVLRPDHKPILDTEFIWKSGSRMLPPGPTLVVGEDDLISPAVDFGAGPIAWKYKTMIDGHRDLGVVFTHIHNTYLAGITRGGYLPQTAIMPENQRNVFSGRRETRRFTLINSLFDPADFVLRWTLTGPDGHVADRGEARRRMDAGELYRGDFAFTPPAVSRRSTFTLATRLAADDQTVCGEEWDLEVWPDEPVAVGPLARTVRLFEPEGETGTARALTAAGVAFERIADLTTLDPRHPPPDTLLVLAEDAITDANAPDTAGLSRFVEAGGRVLVLRQTVSPHNLPVKTVLEPRQWASQVFVRMGSHPVMDGLSDMDLHFWQPDRAVGLGAYSKPPAGPSVTLADSGGVTGMEWAHLLELYQGRGFTLLCQLPVASRYDQEPMAREMLARLVRYGAGEDAFATPTNTLTVLAAQRSPVTTRLRDMRANVTIQESISEPQDGGVLVDASAGRAMPSEDRAALANSLRDGATVVVAGAAPEDAEWISALAGTPVAVQVPPYRMWDGRGYRRDGSRLTAGLSHQDLYWKRFSGNAQDRQQAYATSLIIEPLQDYAVSIADAVAHEHVFPGALVEVAVGRGRLILDQRRWWTSHQNLIVQSSRNLAALLTGLDVGIAPTPPPPELPAGVIYRPIDLTPYANRGLIDEVADDGKGGWSDQGPRADMRSFPTGPQLFKGVPFRIGTEPKVCIVLASQRRPGFDQMPQSVSIPVDHPVEGLFFLHASAYSGAGRHVGSYAIEYEDGQVEEIRLVVGENIHDWNGSHTFLREVGTQSVTAWTGRNETFPLVSVYRMLWVNPRPAETIRQVRFFNPRLANVPILVGLTAAVREGAGSDDETARAATLLAQARAADGAGRLDEAWTLYRRAVDANRTLADAYPAMLSVAQRLRDEDRILETAWTWGLSGLPAYAAWNRFGEVLERRGDMRGALEAYQKSLDMEWNQPSVIDAVQRLETRVNP